MNYTIFCGRLKFHNSVSIVELAIVKSTSISVECMCLDCIVRLVIETHFLFQCISIQTEFKVLLYPVTRSRCVTLVTS